MTTTEAVPGATPSRAARSDRRLYAVIIVLALVIAGFVGYGIRAKQDSKGDQVSTGRAYLGLNQGGVKVGDVMYGFPVNDNDVTWFDARGAEHDRGIPPCMQHRPGYANIRFGHTEVSLPDDSSTYVVTWVQCLPAH